MRGVMRGVMQGVCSLDRLYRFSRHDEAAQGSSGITWVVSAGTLDHKGRIYRYSYAGVAGNDTMEQEVTITLGKSMKKAEQADMVSFYANLRRFTRDTSLAPHFRLACLDLLEEDPWLVAIHGSHGDDVGAGLHAHSVF